MSDSQLSRIDDKDSRISIPCSAYFIISALVIIFWGLTLFHSSKIDEVYESESALSKLDPIWMVDALFADNRREVVYGWPCRALTIVVNDRAPRNVVRKLREVVSEITSISSMELHVQTESSWVRKRDACSKIFIGVSPHGVAAFNLFYADIFRAIYGETDYEYWADQGAFRFTYDATHPCFGFGVYKTSDFLKEGFISRNSPDIAVISIGHALALESSMVYQCLREELAHMIFFIPDRYVAQGSESIFNVNLLGDDIDSYSYLDRELIRFIATNPQIIGLDRKALMYEIADLGNL